MSETGSDAFQNPEFRRLLQTLGGDGIGITENVPSIIHARIEGETRFQNEQERAADLQRDGSW